MKTSETVMLAADVLLLVSLPLLAQGNALVWFGAQGLYFLSVAFLLFGK